MKLPKVDNSLHFIGNNYPDLFGGEPEQHYLSRTNPRHGVNPKTNNPMYRLLSVLCLLWFLFTLDIAGRAMEPARIIMNLALSFVLIITFFFCHIGHRRQRRMANRAFSEL